MADDMTRRMALVGLVWATTVLGAVVMTSAGLTATGSSPGFVPVFAALSVDAVVYASVGAILAIRRPGNRVATSRASAP